MVRFLILLSALAMFSLVACGGPPTLEWCGNCYVANVANGHTPANRELACTQLGSSDCEKCKERKADWLESGECAAQAEKVKAYRPQKS